MRTTHHNDHGCPSWMQCTVVNVSGTHNYCFSCHSYTCGCR